MIESLATGVKGTFSPILHPFWFLSLYEDYLAIIFLLFLVKMVWSRGNNQIRSLHLHLNA
jgi:hypothetical protein